MELRKNPKIDLEKRRGLHFNLGLCIAMLLIMSAFEWRSEIKQLVVLPDEETADLLPPFEPPATRIPPPPKPIVQPTIIEVPDEKEIEEEVEFVLDPVDIEIDDIVDFEPEIIEEKAPEVFDIVEESPSPNGGMSSFYKFLGKHMKYPAQAQRMGIEGRVFVQFVVDTSGKITQIQTIKGIGGGCDEEAERVLALVPKWNPGKQRGRPVNVRMIVPVVFSLNR